MNRVNKTYRLLISIFLTSAFFIFSADLNAQQYTEYEVKTAYVYNFSRFIEWPDTSFAANDKPFVIGVYGEDKFSSVFQKTLEGRQLQGKSWIIKVFDDPEKIDCQILIITENNKENLERLFENLDGRSILTIGDNLDLFCETGGIINFTKRDSAKQFEINQNAADRAKLKISSKLLALAKIVADEEDIF